MQFFSSAEYLSALAESYYPGQPFSIERVRVKGLVFQLLRVRSRLVPWVPFLDFVEPIDSDASAKARYLPAVSVKKVPGTVFQLQPGEQSSPFVDWTRFPRWDDFLSYSRAQSPSGFKSSLQKTKKKLKDVAFTWHDPQALDQICDWKSQQYRASGFPDGFRSPKLRAHFRLLNERGLLTVSTLSVDGKRVAGHVGIVWDGRFYYWLPAYDADYAAQSVGSILLEELLERSYHEGHKEFDFLLGNERYKWGYATGVRIVGPLGQKTAARRAYEAARTTVIARVRKNEALYHRLQTLKRRFLEWSLAR